MDEAEVAVGIAGVGHSLVTAYRQMTTVRLFEETSLELSADGLIAGSIHLCFGQEAIPVGSLMALADRDRVLCTYRGHGWAIASGVPLDLLLGELCQRAGGLNGGRGGSPHLFAPKWGLMGENSIVGAGVPIAGGVALASQAQQHDRVVLASVGEGAMSQGALHEGLVFAAARSLPLIVVVENNGWSEMTRSSSLLRISDLADRGAAYGIRSQVVDGNDPAAVCEAVDEAAVAARAGEGPILLEMKTMRLSGHYNRDIEHYRPKDDKEAAIAADPLVALRTRIVEAGDADADELASIDSEVRREIEHAVEVVREMALPDPLTARDHIVAPALTLDSALDGSDSGEVQELTYIKAITAALETELANRPEAILYGEDVGHAGGIFGASRGLQAKFGEDRVFDTPIAEAAILGSAVGAAMEGMRPIVEVMWADFLFVALDQLINQAANVRYVTRSELTASIVVRTQQGVTPGSCAQHSQSIEAFLAHIPGIKVGTVSNPQDAYAMLRAAVADPDPVIVIESRALYQNAGPVRLDSAVEPVGGARVYGGGPDLLILTWGQMMPRTIEAADALRRQGIDATVVDLRWLSPLDDATIEREVRAGNGRVLIVHEANITGGFGAEIAARIQGRHFDYLDAPIARVGAPDTRIPSAPDLQAALIPDVEAIVKAGSDLVRDE